MLMPTPAIKNDDASMALCAEIGAWRYESLPPAVIQMLKTFLLDAIGVIAGAAHAPGITELNARLSRWESTGSATGLIGKRRYSPPSAALANGAAAHALDYDDQHDPARVHTNCVVFPALLASAEDAGPVNGRNFLLAHAVGAEIHARLGLACYNSLGKGWHPTMVFGTPAAALAAGKLLHLTPPALRDALGIAYHQTSGSAQSMRDGVLTKRLGAGFASRAAVLAAFLAADGISGTRQTLEGAAGLFSLYERGEVDVDRLFDGLGHVWRIPEYSIKPYPCCRCNHTAIEIGIRMHADDVRADEVAGIEIAMGHVNWLTVGAPYDASRDDIVHAQFNAAYGFARALADGKVDLVSYTRPNITAASVVALAAKTRVIDDPAIPETAIEPARVRVTLTSGRVLDVRSDVIKGSAHNPLTENERMAKFYDCLQFGLGAGKSAADRLAEVVLNVERESNAAAAIIAAFPQA